MLLAKLDYSEDVSIPSVGFPDVNFNEVVIFFSALFSTCLSNSKSVCGVGVCEFL